MNLRDEFERIMREQREIALATMSEGLPHVRIVNFYYDTETHCVFFATFKDNEKVVELAANPSIAFTTVPHNNTTEHVRASGHAVKSARSLTAIMDAIVAAGFGVSRSRAASDIAADKLRLNWQPVKGASQVVKPGDILSMRGRGRLEVSEIAGQTKKGRMVVHLKRYI